MTPDSLATRYGLAVAAPLLALALRVALAPWLGDEAPLLIFVLAVVLAGWHGGLRPGLLATGLSLVLADWFLIEPIGSFHSVSLAETTLLAVFAAEGVAISLLGQTLKVLDRKRTQAETTLRERETLLRTLAEHARVGMVMLTADHRYVFANAAYAEALGLAAEDFIGKRVSDLLPPDYASNVAQRLDRAFAGQGRAYELALPPRTQGEGERLFAVSYGAPVHTVHGPCVIVVAVDITERKQAEEALRESEQRLRVIGDNLPDSAVCQYTHAPDGSPRFLYVSAGIAQLRGVVVQDVLRDARTLLGQVAPEYAQQLAEAEARSALELCDIQMEFPIRRSDGQMRWIRLQSRPRRLPDGQLVWDGVQTDITEHKRRERNLVFLAEMQKLLSPLSCATDIMRVASERIAQHLQLKHCLLVEIDEAADSLTVLHDHHAADAASLVGVYRIGDFRTEAERRELAAGKALVIDDLRGASRSAAQAERYKALGMAALVNAPYVADGRWKFMLSAVHGKPHAWPAQDAELLTELAARIYLRLERARAEAGLAASQQRLAGIVDSAIDAIVSIDADQRIVLFNAAAEQMFRCSAAQALGTSIERFLPERSRVAHRAHVHRFGESGTTTRRTMGGLGATLTGLRADGEEFPVETSISKVEAGGEPLFTVILSDVTERKQAEQLARTRDEALRVAAEVAQASKYKSEFLANMSHELRTPLNSLLILSRLLADNAEQNLTRKQVEFAEIMHQSGSDLLRLINEILDLSRIEAGQVEVHVEAVALPDLRAKVERMFGHVAQSRNLDFEVTLDPGLPAAIRSDAHRLEQVLKNLLANSFKFTEKGGVKLSMHRATEGWSQPHASLDAAAGGIAFAVTDTGIGIAPDKQQLIFEAFAQADGTMSRKYGGTGLGLSISRELAALLGGQIALTSQPGVGSTFTLYLPFSHTPVVLPQALAATAVPTGRQVDYSHAPGAGLSTVHDDRAAIASSDDVLLILENDPGFATLLLDIAHRHAFKGLVATNAAAALQLARAHQPAAITLSVTLPDMDGWKLLQCVNDDLALRHIPVHIVSGEDQRPRGLRHGASSYLQKPVNEAALGALFERIRVGKARTHASQLLIVEDDLATQAQIVQAFGVGGGGGGGAAAGASAGDAIEITRVESADQGVAQLRRRRFDCVVLDLRLPGMSGFDFLEAVRDELHIDDLPIVVYTGMDPSPEQQLRLRHLAESVLLKDARSLDRLLDHASLHLRCPLQSLPAPMRATLERLHGSAALLAGARVLVVDDDIRNVYALFAILENAKIEAQHADTGRQCLEMLEANPHFDAVLMDIMMPDMDGFETMRRLRKMKGLETLPVIALTAKAMQGDREQCLAAGASDYLAKPVDAQLLLAQLRFWIQR